RFHVTGVQTCALPIFYLLLPATGAHYCVNHFIPVSLGSGLLRESHGKTVACVHRPSDGADARLLLRLEKPTGVSHQRTTLPDGQIGRASCRERVESRG